jgi:hypothetical protein
MGTAATVGDEPPAAFIADVEGTRNESELWSSRVSELTTARRIDDEDDDADAEDDAGTASTHFAITSR